MQRLECNCYIWIFSDFAVLVLSVNRSCILGDFLYSPHSCSTALLCVFYTAKLPDTLQPDCAIPRRPNEVQSKAMVCSM